MAFAACLTGNAGIESKSNGILIMEDDGFIIRAVFEDAVIQPLGKKLRGASIAPRRQVRPIPDVLGRHAVPCHRIPRLLANRPDQEHPFMRLFTSNADGIAQMTIRTGCGHIGLVLDFGWGNSELWIV
jgi:hypothetical protein